MKVIVAGATGTAGRGIVEACLADERITKVIIVTRRAVCGQVESNPKTEIVMHHDFSQYPEELMQRFEGAEACLWAIGGKVTQFSDKETARKVGVEYTLAGAKAMCDSLAKTSPKFRFVFCSGMLAEWDQNKSLFFLADTRKIKGEVEKGLCDISDAHGDKFEVWIARSSAIIAPDKNVIKKKLVAGLVQGIESGQLGKAMVRMAVEGWKHRIVDYDVLLKM